jgi:hypothetical protein
MTIKPDDAQLVVRADAADRAQRTVAIPRQYKREGSVVVSVADSLGNSSVQFKCSSNLRSKLTRCFNTVNRNIVAIISQRIRETIVDEVLWTATHANTSMP